VLTSERGFQAKGRLGLRSINNEGFVQTFTPLDGREGKLIIIPLLNEGEERSDAWNSRESHFAAPLAIC
jgi:hypothetical protein